MGSKNSKSGKGATAVQEQQATEVVPSSEVQEKPAVDKRSLFLAFDATDTELKAAEAALDAAKQRRSDAVKAIAVNCGNGPFSWGGREVSVTTRTEKKPDANGEQVEVVRYFFKTFKKAVEVI
jgi:hypothetical protein